MSSEDRSAVLLLLDAVEKMGLKLQQSFFDAALQGKAAEELRRGVLSIRDRMSAMGEKMRRVSGEVLSLSGELKRLEEFSTEAARLEAGAKELIQGALSDMSRMDEFLSDMEQAARANEELLAGLVDAADQVSGLLSQIGRVTRQTQMLALNAAIEAARAGDAGRGFSVVAREVGNLALSTQDIAGRIDRSMGDLREKLKAVSTAMERTRNGLLEGSSVMRATSSSVEGAGAAALELGGRLREITDMVLAQSRLAEELAVSTSAMADDASTGAQEAQGMDRLLSKEAETASKLTESLRRMGLSLEELQRKALAVRPRDELWVGFTPFASPEEIKASYGPIVEGLAGKLGKRCRLFVSHDYGSLGEGLKDGRFDVAWFSPLAYVVAAERVPMRVLGIPKVKGRPSYRGLIIARRDSGIKGLSDLKGRRFAFVDASSGSGYLYPRVLMSKSGLDPKRDLGGVLFLGTHDRVIEAVLSGEVDAGATYTDAWDGAAKKKDLSPLVVLATTEEIPKDAVAVLADLDGAEAERIAEALLSLGVDDPAAGSAMRSLGIDGFVKGDDSMYHVIREARRVGASM
ncbi:phosphate/phosphite/phosphonate ABC transporter, periplasmic binding protein [Thermanaerovibrio velox DSM 12556]|uniref:Phosphate/phosphite/phosphonate ABC transporter, periplasmic binding protein n=1 Tax=Thermanaerovibrio velox DSM 12556 TaxID=926567 RepID=H0UQ67_9BACT|nr:phosphate/phosphite/phosphonate ABC transporter substrate-binding protein [Thermanaerovibrio velox]EHM10705.1 phosphate/phosphite/phosphonate ABC transporter, periplasmic binding protein [Thermanaerovibrio velox DSM 12556]